MIPGAPKADNPEDYIAQLDGWRLKAVEALRAAVKAAAPLDERIKWTHLVYFSNGPVLLIRAEAERVLFGFWRGKRLRHIEPRLKPGGKFELATMVLRAGDAVDTKIATELVRAAVDLNRELGDPSKPNA
ncbi:hypothetical protein SAMN04515666_11093 [Bosea lupini]|uniref:YdhG-like domain-containing protein n=1 Tax=Bosea lupini TaxID=1036779 RepID=A0A1H7XN72_9HYPH|nr:DUF1801 domain-containing protein [Bosea lupini]SEM35074.1 hypothetical protein SAMN04515666_11093 [Bosea lupini]